MLNLLAVAFLWLAQSGAAKSIDVASLKVGPPITIGELDLGKLRGELRKLSWSDDGAQLFVQTGEGDTRSPSLRHYLVTTAGGAIAPVAAEPEWAADYWANKSSKEAPGIATMKIVIATGKDVTTGMERAGRNGDFDINQTVAAINTTSSADKLVLLLLDVAVGEITPAKPIPGFTFSWGPEGSGAIVYTDMDGKVRFLDQQKHRSSVDGVKDAAFPAWSTDGARLAWVQKSGRKKYTLVWAPVTKG